MAADPKDPREAVAHRALAVQFDAGKAEVSPHYPARRTFTPTELLARLDAADPLRAMLREVVEALEGLVEGEGDGLKDLLKARITLARLREFNREEG